MDRESQAELPDETPDPRLLPTWMRQPAPRPLLPASAEPAEPIERGAELLDPPAPLSHGELDAALPGWLLTPPRPAPMLPPRKTPPLAELAEAVDGPELELVDPPAPEEEGEVELARLPAWMRGAPEHGPPEEPESQAAVGAEQDDSAEWLPE